MQSALLTSTALTAEVNALKQSLERSENELGLPKSSSRTRNVSNTLWKYIKDVVAKNSRNNVRIAGAMNEVATLKEAVSKAESSAATERTE